MFSDSAVYYDAIYAAAGKDYAAESRRITELAREHLRPAGRTPLDVGCGTGSHLAHPRDSSQVDELELDPGLLSVARHRLPGVPLHQGDMADFDVNQPDLKIARLRLGELEGKAVSVLRFDYVMATPNGIRHFTELHRLGLFADEAYAAALADCGLEFERDEAGLNGRGLYLGLVPDPRRPAP